MNLQKWRVWIGFAIALGTLIALPVHAQDDEVRIKDIGKIGGWRANALVGYGLVTGLAGTGDSSRSKATRQSISNMLSRFGLETSSDDVQSHNVAAVMVTASLAPFARPGDTIDVTVTSIGDARSLVGGLLMITPLKGADDKVYGLAQGAISVGGYKYDLNGNVVQKNHPTVGSVPNGATVEASVPGAEDTGSSITFVLSDPDYTTANRVAASINAAFPQNFAIARDAGGIEIALLPEQRNNIADLVARLENVRVTPDVRSRVVINERTGTVVTGGDVHISKVAISQGELKVSIATENDVSQPIYARQRSPNVRTQEYSNSQISVSEGGETGFVSARNNTVADLVEALTKLKTNTRDIISILRAVKAAGALHADLIIQ